jgi:general secretion pathway protein A
VNATVSPPSREAPQYEEFYGFVQSPFTLAPDPRFLYLSESHDHALRQLQQTIAGTHSVAVLTGDVGTGKTTVCRALLERLDPTCFTSLHLNPFLSVEELLREMLLDFGVVSREAVRSGRVAAATKTTLVSTLREFLASLLPIGGSGVLIIDEAQHLSPVVLDELRALSELEANDRRLLHIVLVGQPNLLALLSSPDVQPLDQRISTRVTLNPLTRAEVEHYIAHRLSVAHGSSSIAFDADAYDQIYDASRGVPRVINLVCDRSLMIGAGFGMRTITGDVIEESATALGLRTPVARATAWRDHIWRWVGLTAAVIALIAALLLFAWPLSNPF